MTVMDGKPTTLLRTSLYREMSSIGHHCISYDLLILILLLQNSNESCRAYEPRQNPPQAITCVKCLVRSMKTGTRYKSIFCSLHLTQGKSCPMCLNQPDFQRAHCLLKSWSSWQGFSPLLTIR